MINLKEAFEDLHDRITKQVAEKMWELERVKPLNKKAFEKFQGTIAIKKETIKQIKEELAERKENLKVVKKIIEKYENDKQT